MKRFYWFSLMVMLLLFVTSCTDKAISSSGEDIRPSEELVTIEAACNDYSLNLKTDEKWTAKVADEWIYLEDADGQGSKEIKFFAEENNEDESRTTTLDVTLADGSVKTFTIKQKGLSESGENALGEGVYQKHGVCFGYNGYGKYADANAITDQIINEKKAKELMDEYASGESSVQTESYEIIENIESTGTSAEDLSESLGVNASLNVNVPSGFSLDIKANYNSEDLQNSSKNFSKRKHKRILYRKTISVQNLMGLMEEEPDAKNKILTLGFKSALKKLTSAVKTSGTDANPALKEFISKYGTHIVVMAELGGCFDYSMVTDKNDISSKKDISAGLDMGYKKMFNIKGDATYDKMNKKIGSNYTCKVTVKGGDASILSAATNGQMDNTSDDITKWEKTITHENSLMIDHQLMPIWDVIEDATVSEAVQQYITTGEYIKAVPDYSLPTPERYMNGCIKVPLSSLKESINDNGTLVYTIEAAGSPIAEICHELIPIISSSQRVFVAYPIVQNKPDYSKGFFLGDGALNSPGYVEWIENDNKYIYKSDEQYNSIDCLDTLFIEGTGKTLSISGKANSTVSKWITGYVQPAYAKFYKYSTYKKSTALDYYNIVKVGKQVWTRENIATPYGVGYKKFTHYATDNGDFFYQWSDYFLKTQWSVPTADSFAQLQKIANEGKPLLKGGSTGLDIDVLGCYSVTQKKIRKFFKIKTENSAEPQEIGVHFMRTADQKVIGIYKDGVEPLFEMQAEENMYYPVRFVRSENFQYE